MVYKNITLVQIPRIDPNPSLGLALIHNTLTQAGVQCNIFDANLDLHKKLSNHTVWHDIELWGIYQRSWLELDQLTRFMLTPIIQDWITQIKSTGADLVGISVYTVESRNWAEIFCYHLRRYMPEVTILLGGRGLNPPGRATADFAKKMLDWHLCDAYLNGESESEILAFMQGLSELANRPQGWFANHNMERERSLVLGVDQYRNYTIQNNWYDVNDTALSPNISLVETKPKLKTEATRGCVKRCTFCDVHLVRERFSMRDPVDLFSEMRRAIEDHGVTKVVFSDDMINGSNRHFMSWLTMLDRYLTDQSIVDFQWQSQFGIKHQRSTPQDLFALMHRTGAFLTVGIDHFSDPVLEHMNKKYSNSDIYHYLESWLQYPVRLRCMLIAAYPTETLHDHEQQRTGLLSLRRYRDLITAVDLGDTCTIPVGSPLEKLSGMQLGANRLDWYYQGNPDLTAAEKLRRRKELDDILQSLDISNRKQRTHWVRMQVC